MNIPEARTVKVVNMRGEAVQAPIDLAPVYKARHADSQYTRALAIRNLDYRRHRRLIRQSALCERGSRAGIAAAQKLDPSVDIDVLVRLVRWHDLATDPGPAMRAIATGKIPYQGHRQLLRDIAVHDPDCITRSIAVRKLDRHKDADVLNRMLNDPRWQVMDAARERLGLESKQAIG